MYKERDARTFVVLSISLVKPDEYLLELVQKSLLAKKTRRERWRAHDEYCGESEEIGSPFLSRIPAPVFVPMCTSEFGDLDPHVGMEVKLQITPVGV